MRVPHRAGGGARFADRDRGVPHSQPLPRRGHRRGSDGIPSPARALAVGGRDGAVRCSRTRAAQPDLDRDGRVPGPAWRPGANQRKDRRRARTRVDGSSGGFEPFVGRSPAQHRRSAPCAHRAVRFHPGHGGHGSPRGNCQRGSSDRRGSAFQDRRRRRPPAPRVRRFESPQQRVQVQPSRWPCPPSDRGGRGQDSHRGRGRVRRAACGHQRRAFPSVRAPEHRPHRPGSRAGHQPARSPGQRRHP